MPRPDKGSVSGFSQAKTMQTDDRPPPATAAVMYKGRNYSSIASGRCYGSDVFLRFRDFFSRKMCGYKNNVYICTPETRVSQPYFFGEMPEWSIGPHSKCGVRATVPGVRIPLSPPSPEVISEGGGKQRQIPQNLDFAGFLFLFLRHPEDTIKLSAKKEFISIFCRSAVSKAKPKTRKSPVRTTFRY